MVRSKLQVLTRLLVHGAVLTALFACSSEPVNEPSELVPYLQTIEADRVWSSGVGDGDEELNLEFRPVLSNGLLYTIDRYGVLTVTEPKEGDEVWERELEEQVSAGLGYDRSHLYYATFQGDLVCLDRENGNEIWRRQLSSEALASPVSSGSSVAVQTIDGKLFVFETSEGHKTWQYDSADPILTLRGTAQPQFHQGLLIAAFANGELRAFEARNGRMRWKASIGIAQGRTELERLVDVDGDPLISEETVYALGYQGNLMALDLRTGGEKWRKASSSFKNLAIKQEQLIATLEDGTVVSINAGSGEELWRNDQLKYRRLSKPTIIGDHILVADFEGYIHALAVDSGAINMRIQPDSDGVMEHIVPAGKRFFVHTRSGDLIAYKLKAHEPVYRVKRVKPLGRRDHY